MTPVVGRLNCRKTGIEYLSVQIAWRPIGMPNKDSINLGWHHEAFRGYADYMQIPAFESAIDDLQQQAKRAQTAIMCGERRLPWQLVIDP